MHDDMLGGEWTWDQAEEDGKIHDAFVARMAREKAEKDAKSGPKHVTDKKPLSPADRAKAVKAIQSSRKVK